MNYVGFKRCEDVPLGSVIYHNHKYYFVVKFYNKKCLCGTDGNIFYFGEFIWDNGVKVVSVKGR